MPENGAKWFDGFAGVGYYFHDVRPLLLLVFEKRPRLFDTWKKTLKWWPEDDIRLRFVEKGSTYRFIMYCESLVPDTNTVFLKLLNMSENYTRFKSEYEGAANLALAIRHKSKEDKFELEIFKFRKRLTNVRFMTDAETDDRVVSSTNNFFEALLEK